MKTKCFFRIYGLHFVSRLWPRAACDHNDPFIPEQGASNFVLTMRYRTLGFVQGAFAVPLFCYAVVIYFSFSGYKTTLATAED